MNFSIPVGDGHLVEYIGNFWTGAEQLKADGKIIFQRSTRESFFGCRKNEFSLGSDDRIKVVFETERPIFYQNLRPYTYRVFADGRLLHEETGF